MEGDEDMEEDAQQATKHGQTKLLPAGQVSTNPRQCMTTSKGQPRCQLGKYQRRKWPLPTFTIPNKARTGPPTVGITVTEMRNTYSQMAPLGFGTEARDIERLSFSLRSKRRIRITREQGKGPNTPHPGNPTPTGPRGAR